LISEIAKPIPKKQFLNLHQACVSFKSNQEVLKYWHMSADSLPINRPLLVLRVHNYNLVSFGALLGACPEELLSRFEIVLWESNNPAPEIYSRRSLLLYSFMMPAFEFVEAEIRKLQNDGGYRRDMVTFIAGGAQATAASEQVLRIGFDALVAGEGETIFPKILQSWLNGEIPKGVIVQGNDWVNLNNFPGFHRITGYLPPIEISRGCTYGCCYCVVPFLYKCTLRHRSVEKIVEIALMYKQMNPKRRRVKFLASNSFAYGSSDGKTPNIKALKHLLTGLKEAGIPKISLGSFPSEVRPDFVTPEVMETVAPFLSNKSIVMGVQTVGKKMLAALNRGHDIEQAKSAIKLLRAYGFKPHVDFIIGLPGEKFDEQETLLTFMEEMVNLYAIKIHMHTFMPLPGAAWQNCFAAPISKNARTRLRALDNAGVLDGWWENQIAYSRRKK